MDIKECVESLKILLHSLDCVHSSEKYKITALSDLKPSSFECIIKNAINLLNSFNRNDGNNFCGNCKYCNQTTDGRYICIQNFIKYIDPDDASCLCFKSNFKDNYNDFKDFCTSDAEICKSCKYKDTEVCYRCSHFPF